MHHTAQRSAACSGVDCHPKRAASATSACRTVREPTSRIESMAAVAAGPGQAAEPGDCGNAPWTEPRSSDRGCRGRP